MWETTIPRGRIRKRVSVAVLAVDDFTGKPIRDAALTVTARQLLTRPIRKKDGYYIFLNCEEPVLDIEARSWAYHTASIRVDVTALPRLRPVVRLLLTPNRNYAIPSQTTCIEGSAPAGSEIRLLCSNDPRPLRLLYDYKVGGPEEGKLIRLYDPTGSDLEGRMLALRRKSSAESGKGAGGTDMEFFTVLEASEEEEGGFRLENPLTHDSKKAGTVILPVSCARADEKGQFFIPLKTLAVKTYQCRILWRVPDGDWQELKNGLELEPGQVTRLDLNE